MILKMLKYHCYVHLTECDTCEFFTTIHTYHYTTLRLLCLTMAETVCSNLLLLMMLSVFLRYFYRVTHCVEARYIPRHSGYVFDHSMKRRRRERKNKKEQKKNTKMINVDIKVRCDLRGSSSPLRLFEPATV